MLLCDFFPLYEFSGSCSATAEANENRGNLPVGNSDDRESSQFMGLSLAMSESSVPYGMQRKHRPSVSEMILVLWIISLVLEEIRQVSKYFVSDDVSIQSMISFSFSQSKLNQSKMPLSNIFKSFGINLIFLQSFCSSLDSHYDLSTVTTVSVQHVSFSQLI